MSRPSKIRDTIFWILFAIMAGIRLPLLIHHSWEVKLLEASLDGMLFVLMLLLAVKFLLIAELGLGEEEEEDEQRDKTELGSGATS
jgi:hypothetical protein